MSDVATSTPANRTWEGVEIPVAGTYGFDVSHSRVGFVVRHLMVSKVRGQFTRFEGAVVVAENPTDSTVEVSIDAASIDTRDETATTTSARPTSSRPTTTRSSPSPAPQCAT